VKTIKIILALPKGQALRYIFFCHIWQQKKDAAAILNALTS